MFDSTHVAQGTRSEAPMISLHRILVPTDFGEAAEAALAYGRELAQTFNGRLTVLHVVDNLLLASAGVDGYVGAYPDLQREVEQAARTRLDGLLSPADIRERGAVGVLRTSSTPALTIINYAKDANFDLIVMGTHGRGPVTHLLMGSVAERVVRTAPCPVLTVKHPEHEFVVPDPLAVGANA
jgi:nucleotide-binding universal stress UspA family protein